MVQVSQAELIKGANANYVVSFPTDTVPGELLSYTSYTSTDLAAWQELIKEYLPGALTLVLPASSKVNGAINPTSSNTIGIRIPDHPIAIEILRQTGVLATSSANISGQKTLQDKDAIDKLFPDVLVLAKSDFPTEERISSGNPSTIVRWQDRTWHILRQGSIKIKLKK